MEIVSCSGNDNLAMVYVARLDNGEHIEFVESLQPPLPREKKWVIIVSTLVGCPVRCRFCDAGGFYRGMLDSDAIFAQIDHVVHGKYADGRVPAEKFKIQFARMGEPALNRQVLDVLKKLPTRYHAPGLMPCVSTVAPVGAETFFEELTDIKRTLYPRRFQLQFSIHTTDLDRRDWLVPMKKWDFTQIGRYGETFHQPGERKIALNFALAEGSPIDPAILLNHFDPAAFMIKLTPINPTHTAVGNQITSGIDPDEPHAGKEIAAVLREAGYDVIISIGEVDENKIGSNCGQYVLRHLQAEGTLDGGYTEVCHATGVSSDL